MQNFKTHGIIDGMFLPVDLIATTCWSSNGPVDYFKIRTNMRCIQDTTKERYSTFSFAIDYAFGSPLIYSTYDATLHTLY